MTKQSKILAGLLAGAAVGAAVALVLSNDNDDMKDKISDWMCDILSTSKDRLTEVTDLVKETVAKVKA